jgi:inositol phosphorylceramide synthase catalytic subunit
VSLAAPWRHARALWPRWTLLPPLPFVLWTAFCWARGLLRWEHVALTVVVTALAYGTARTRDLLRGLYPMGLVALLYDGMRFFKNVGLGPGRIHDCDLRALDLRLFGLSSGGERITVHDWLLPRGSLPLDLYAAVPYGTYLFACVGFAAFLYFRDLRSPGERLLARFSWGFFFLNVAAFATYHLYPAAPPWYFHAHGCAIDLGASSTEGPRLARVDALLGVRYFHDLYGRSSDVFGAVPSLHVAYPLLMLLVGFRVLGRAGRALVVFFAVSMCFAAVYLDHHWIVDVVLGLLYALVVNAGVRRVLLSRPRGSGATRSRSGCRAASPPGAARSRRAPPSARRC